AATGGHGVRECARRDADLVPPLPDRAARQDVRPFRRAAATRVPRAAASGRSAEVSAADGPPRIVRRRPSYRPQCRLAVDLPRERDRAGRRYVRGGGPDAAATTRPG